MRRRHRGLGSQRSPRDISTSIAASCLLAVVVLTAGALVPALGSTPTSELAEAARRNDVEEVRVLIAGGADADAALGDGMTGLHWAAVHGAEGITAMLIDAGAALDLKTRIGNYTPLHLAARGARTGVVEALLMAGADATAVTSTGAVTALHFAAMSGDAISAWDLVAGGVPVDARETQWGQTPLMFAAAANRPEVIAALLRAGADPAIVADVIDIPTREQEDRIAARNRGQTPTPTTANTPTTRSVPEPTSPQRAATVAPVQPSGRAPQEQLLGTTEIDPLSYADLVGSHGGLTALLLAAREGNVEAVDALLAGGADINQRSAGDGTPPMLMATINGHFDLALEMLERGADPTAASDAGATPLYAVINMHWVPKSRHPQPTDYMQQQVSYLDAMRILLEAGVDPNVRLEKTLWFTTYNNDLLRVDRAGATPFWRAAFALDIEAMKLLIEYGADPGIPTKKMPSRSRPRDDDPSGLAPVPVGGAAVYPIHAASGVGYGQGYAGNSHRHVPGGWLPAVKYLVEEHGADVNARDVNGYSPVHHAASRGDNELIEYLVSQGADVTFVSRRGQTTVDMANGPVQRIQPFPSTIELLEGLGAKNNHNCVSC